MITLTKKELSDLIKHASADETRAHIACLRIDDEDGRVIATDGHRLSIWSRTPIYTLAGSRGRSHVGPPLAASIAIQGLKAALKFAPASGEISVDVTHNDGPYAQALDRHGVSCGPRIPLAVLTLAFPAWEQVIPAYALREKPAGREEGAAVAWACNARYIAEAVEYCAGREKGQEGVRMLAPPDPLSPLVIRSVDACRLVVVMPMRID